MPHERGAVNHTFIFDESRDFSWDEFDAYVTSKLGYSLSRPSSPMKDKKDSFTNLIYTIPNDYIIFELDKEVEINIDLEGNGRFLVMNDTHIEFVGSGESHFKISNGSGVWYGNIEDQDENWSNAAGIRQNSDILNVIGCNVHVDDSVAGGAVGMYLFEGECSLMDNGPGIDCCLYFNNNEVVKSSSAGLSIWKVHFTIFSDDGCVKIENCSTITHCGAWCDSGVPLLIFTGPESKIIAEGCIAGNASGIFIQCCDIKINNTEPVFNVINNTTVDDDINDPVYDSPSCAIKFVDEFNININEGKIIKIIAYDTTPCYDVYGDENLYELVIP